MSSASPTATALFLVTFTTLSVFAMAYMSQQETKRGDKKDKFILYKRGSSLNAEKKKEKKEKKTTVEKPPKTTTVRMAFLGNSMLYFNDCPRLVEQMADEKFIVVQDSCLRPDAKLASLAIDGNGMGEKFATEQARNKKTGRYELGSETVRDLLKDKEWDYVVMNDYTQNPARETSRKESIQALTETYAPLLFQQKKADAGDEKAEKKKTVVPVIIQTPAYRVEGIKNSADLGNLDAFTDKLAVGVQEYAKALDKAAATIDGNSSASSAIARIAPVGEAYRWLYHNEPQLWKKLYSWDDFHPSPYGTWLQACIIYIVCFNKVPPRYNPMWWEQCRYMQPPDQKPLPLPTEQEAAELHGAACMVCGLFRAQQGA